MSKPKEILMLEEELGVKFVEVPYNEENDSFDFEYSTNSKGQVIRLFLDLLTSTELNKLPKNISNCRNLKKILVQNSSISDFNEIRDLKELEYLNLAFNNITDISWVKDLTKLKRLVLSTNQITNISSIKNVKNLIELDLSYNQITDILSIKNAKNLIKLDLSYNQITDISSIENLKNLKELYLSSNRVTKITSLKNLIFLKTLDLSNNFISDISALSALSNLEFLYLENNIIEDISALNKITSLNDFKLSENQISNILALKNLVSIERLYLDNNKIIDISALSNLSKLKFLALEDNQIKDVTPLKNLISLEDIYLKNNQIKDISFIINLRNLITIDLYSNQIENIPPDIVKLPNLNLASSIYNSKNLNFKYSFIFQTSPEELERFNQKLKSKIPKLLNIPNLGKIFHGERFSFIETEKNQVFLEVFKDSGIYIYMLGNPSTQKEILYKIRAHFDKELNDFEPNFKNNKNSKIVQRTFSYPINDEYNLIVLYDSLIAAKRLNEIRYFVGEETIPIDDLIEYIGIKDDEINKKWQGTDYITNIEVKNFKLFEHLKFELQPNINIILGHNGLGKTSILQSISIGLLSPTSNNENKPNDYEKYIKKNTERAEIFVNYGEKEQRHLHVDKSGLIVFKSAQIEKNLLLSYGVNLNSDQEKIEIIEKLIEGNGDKHYTASIFKDYSNDFNNPQTLLFELIQQEADVANQIIDLLMDTLNEFLKLMPENETLILVKNGSRFKFKDFAGNLLDINHLSEGYKDHILLITDIVTRIIAARNTLFGKDVAITVDLLTNAKGIILIDEFDRHLHPSWQRKLLPQLKKTFPNIQFILTTHNPFSLQSAVGANAIELFIENGEIKAENSIIKQQNILGIIEKYYTKDFFDNETQNLLKEFSKLLDKIYEGNIDLVYSSEFRNVVQKLYNLGDEINSEITANLNQLNSELKKLNKEEFAL